MSIDRLAQRQVDLGVASYFYAEPEATPGNQIIVRAGFIAQGAHGIIDAYTGGDQTTAAFAAVTSGKRYDLVYIDNAGVAQIEQGNEVSLGAADFDGAPGRPNGPALPDQAYLVALVFVDETSGVVVDADDITVLGFATLSRDLDGFLVDKGLYGSAPAGASDDVSALFTTETPGGGTSDPGVVTSPPLNYVHLVDQNSDEILHGTGARVYGRITEAASTWTLSYYYVDASGTEQVVDPSGLSPAPTDVQLIGTPKVYSRNDPNRPLFDSSVARLSDQIAGDIPQATSSIAGKAFLITDGAATSASAALGTTDNRAGRVYGVELGAETGTGPVTPGTPTTARRGEIALVEGANVTIEMYDDSGNDRVCFKIAASSGTSLTYGSLSMQPDGTPSYGSMGYYVGTNHVHPLSSSYATSGHGHTGIATYSGSGTPSARTQIVIATGQNPVLAIVASNENNVGRVSFMRGSGGSLGAEHECQTTGPWNVNNAFAVYSAGTWNTSHFNSTQFRAAGASHTIGYAGIVLSGFVA